MLVVIVSPILRPIQRLLLPQKLIEWRACVICGPPIAPSVMVSRLIAGRIGRPAISPFRTVIGKVARRDAVDLVEMPRNIGTDLITGDLRIAIKAGAETVDLIEAGCRRKVGWGDVLASSSAMEPPGDYRDCGETAGRAEDKTTDGFHHPCANEARAKRSAGKTT
jgi:hypothetical protein